MRIFKVFSHGLQKAACFLNSKKKKKTKRKEKKKLDQLTKTRRSSQEDSFAG